MTRLFPKPPGGRLTSFRFKDKGEQETTATSAPVRGQTRRPGSRRNVKRASCTPVCPYSAREGHPAPGPRIVPGRASVGPRRTMARSRGTAPPPADGRPGNHEPRVRRWPRRVRWRWKLWSQRRHPPRCHRRPGHSARDTRPGGGRTARPASSRCAVQAGEAQALLSHSRRITRGAVPRTS